ncbi:MAG: bifunctional diaminohydroxyphosphoribosylaminopyrimidine deaminase/5-amino-6-(5-phosphoribosylamino)uracil reductase RibD [Saprospiraceae bacterium]
METVFSKKQKLFIRRAFDLARLAEGSAVPNPLVGAVIVFQDRIIGEGYFKGFGQPHAEVNAVANVKENDRQYLTKSEIYVSLEPCNFFGKTPPCTSLILKSKIPKVIISAIDKTPQVSGNGIDLLRQNGVEVLTGILEKEGNELVKYRTNYVERKSPFIILKFAQSKDGFLGQKNKSVWITNHFSKTLVHKWRSEINAIMIGTNTARQDNPRLTSRLYFGKNPLRIVLDRKNDLPEDLHIFSDGFPTWQITENLSRTFPQKNITQIEIPFNDDLLKNLLEKLHQEKIGTLLVEGGAQLLQSFIDQNLWQEARIFEGNKYLKKGIIAPQLPVSPNEEIKIENDILRIFHNP